MVFLVCVEGVVGSGKSTLMDRLSSTYTCLREPLEDWSLLAPMYDDMPFFAAPFQFQVLFSFHKIYSTIARLDDVVIVERSPWSSKNVFVEAFRQNGHFQRDEYDVYCKFYDKIAYPVDAYVYLKVDTEVAHRRILSRGRPQERSMTVDHLVDLNDRYDRAFSNMNCCVVDANRPIDVVKSEVVKAIESMIV